MWASIPLQSAREDTNGIVACNVFALALAAVTSLALAFLSNPPVYDSALFEYIGRSISSGHSLYRDIWDNKLPSIFYVNALWNFVLGPNTTAHAVAEASIDLMSAAIFARLLFIEGLKFWGVPAAVLAVLLSVIGYANFTEHYALSLILIGVLCAREGKSIASGVAITLAASFWIPALLTLGAIPIGDRRRKYGVFVGIAGTATAMLSLLAYAYGFATCAELLSSWTSYLGSGESLATRFRDVSAIAVPMSIILSLAAFGLACSWRVRRSEKGRFALLWLSAALLGGILPLHPFVHYFLPAIPASIYAVLAAEEPISYRRAAFASIIAMVLVVFYVAHGHRRIDSEPARVSRLASILRANLPPGAHIALDGYEPGVYLGAGVSLRDRFELAYYANERFVAARKNTTLPRMLRGYTDGADAFISMNGAESVPMGAAASFEVCRSVVAPWHLFVRPSIARVFVKCGLPSAQ